MSENIVAVTQENAQAVLIEESLKRPVLIDFWSDRSAPCKSLSPVLEKLATAYGGDFLLAKVNADEENMIASQFGVRSLPTVMLMKDGQPVDGFAGTQSEAQVSEFLAKHLPSPWQKVAAQGAQMVGEERFGDAMALLQPAFVESEQSHEIALPLAAALMGAKRLDDAESVLKTVRMADQSAEYHALISQLELAREAKKAPEIEALESQLATDPDNKNLMYQLAVQYGQHGYQSEALGLLYCVIRGDLAFNDGEAKKIYMDIIAVMGKGDPVAVAYQRKLYALLY